MYFWSFSSKFLTSLSWRPFNVLTRTFQATLTWVKLSIVFTTFVLSQLPELMRGLDIETKKPACLAQSWPGPVSSGSAECGIRWGEDIRSGHSSLQNQTVISIIRRWKQAPVFKLYTFLIKCSVIPCICTWYFNEDYCCGVDRQMQSGDVTKRKADNGGTYIVIVIHETKLESLSAECTQT